MSDLAEFLLARIAEDEAAAHYALSRGSLTDGAESVLAGQWLGWVDHAERWMPARVLAECDAKRRIIVRCQEMQSASVPMAAHLASTTLDDLALPYADHPDYREEWRP